MDSYNHTHRGTTTANGYQIKNWAQNLKKLVNILFFFKQENLKLFRFKIKDTIKNLNGNNE